jgi:hypothetical protein
MQYYQGANCISAHNLFAAYRDVKPTGLLMNTGDEMELDGGASKFRCVGQ